MATNIDRASFNADRASAMEFIEDSKRKNQEQDQKLDELAKQIDELAQSKFPIGPVWQERILLFSQVCFVVTVLACVAYVVNPVAVTLLLRSFFQG